MPVISRIGWPFVAADSGAVHPIENTQPAKTTASCAEAVERGERHALDSVIIGRRF
jgi:hypothetical protein